MPLVGWRQQELGASYTGRTFLGGRRLLSWVAVFIILCGSSKSSVQCSAAVAHRSRVVEQEALP